MFPLDEKSFCGLFKRKATTEKRLSLKLIYVICLSR